MPVLPARFYVPGESFFHKLDARVKMIWLMMIFIYSAILTDPVILASLLASTIVIGAVSRVHLRRVAVIYRLYLVLIIICFFLFGGIFGSGPVLFRLWIFTFTLGGLAFWMITVFRFTMFPSAAIVFFMTTDQPDIVLGLKMMRVPYKLAFVVSALFRYLPLVMGIWNSVVEAQTSRGLNLKTGSVVSKFRKSLKLLPPVLFSVLLSARTNALAIESKAFGAYPKRTEYRILTMRRRDYTVLAIIVGLIATGVILRVAFGQIVFLSPELTRGLFGPGI